MNIYLGSDHAGYELKNKLQEYLRNAGHRAVDLGVFSIEEPADYPDIAHEVAEKVRENGDNRGILVCGTGIGMCMAANKTKGIRAAQCENESAAEMARRHNNANILCLGGRVTELENAKKILDVFLRTEFDIDERHARRVGKIDQPKTPPS